MSAAELQPGPTASRLGYVLVALSAVCASGGGVFARLAIDAGVAPEQIAGIRIYGAATLLLVAFLPHARKVRRSDLLPMVLFSLSGLVLGQGAYFQAISRVDIAIVLVVVFTAPLVVTAYQRIRHAERLPRYAYGAVLVAIAGVTMAILGSVVGALSTFYQDSLDVRDPRQVEVSVHRLLAKLPTIAAYSHKKSIGQPLIYPRNDLSYCENFLQMMFAVPCEEYHCDPDFADALDMLLIVHADHEQNCSTSTVRMVGSSDANLFASISAGISALWGPLHGGANQACVEMLEKIGADGGNVKKYVDLAKKKDSGFRLMGFGHRVYKNYDPRAKLIKATCDKLLAKLSLRDPIFDIAQQLEEVALADEYFIERKLYPNVDFYSGVIYRAMGIPVQMFTVLFAMGRLPGWIAHWIEMHQSPTKKICRPRQIYTGETLRDFIPITKRG